MEGQYQEIQNGGLSKFNDVIVKETFSFTELSTIISFQLKIVVFTGPKEGSRKAVLEIAIQEKMKKKKYNIHRYTPF